MPTPLQPPPTCAGKMILVHHFKLHRVVSSVIIYFASRSLTVTFVEISICLNMQYFYLILFLQDTIFLQYIILLLQVVILFQPYTWCDVTSSYTFTDFNIKISTVMLLILKEEILLFSPDSCCDQCLIYKPLYHNSTLNWSKL